MRSAVTSDRRARGKRAGAWGIALRRLMALALTLAALTCVHAVRPPAATTATPATSPAQPTPALPPAEVDIRLDLAGAPNRAPPRRRVATGVPLDAAPTQQPDDYEILSAAELDAISQAPD